MEQFNYDPESPHYLNIHKIAYHWLIAVNSTINSILFSLMACDTIIQNHD